MQNSGRASVAADLAERWGCVSTVELYLDICQVDTPPALVSATWEHVRALRPAIDLVVDFGAGDGRFAHSGDYNRYIGYEVDRTRIEGTSLPKNAELREACAFSAAPLKADLCIGNPPFVRNQSLPKNWRATASSVVQERTGVAISGLANAWQYFFLLALSSVKDDGLCALVVPYEWVSRPSSAALRQYIRANGWNVDVYRLVDSTFASVLTTASITIVDKARTDSTWRFFEEASDGSFVALESESGALAGPIRYARRSDVKADGPRAVRGLSPGTQKLLTLTEAERARHGLEIGRDVVACVTTLRYLPKDVEDLDAATFRALYRDAGHKSWLLNTANEPSSSLKDYLDATPEAGRQTSTCLERDTWWRFKMPSRPDMLTSQHFRSRFPKLIDNTIGALAVGGVTGLYGLTPAQRSTLLSAAATTDLEGRIVSHSNGLHKIEINQLNTLLPFLLADLPTRQ